MENSLLAIFDEIWPKTLDYSTGSLAKFWCHILSQHNVQFTCTYLALSHSLHATS